MKGRHGNIVDHGAPQCLALIHGRLLSERSGLASELSLILPLVWKMHVVNISTLNTVTESENTTLTPPNR